ncbi:MAG: DUF2089 domain-containing protein [Bacillota bacterium]|nr:DUF2089 domain-containing protein [Bacillota bacterium]
MKKYLDKCPVCDGKLITTSYSCQDCGSQINGYFEGNKFLKLSEEDLEFIEIFVMNRGSIKEIEKVLGVSYPTVRNKLDQVIKALGHKVSPDKSRMEILEMLDQGLITADQATEMMKNLN